MDNKRRHKRIRLLFSKLNERQKRQAKKIDILCNDLIAAQRSFVKSLDTISFTANFYESIIGTTNLDDLLYTACKLIKDEIPDANVSFFLCKADNFKLHMFESDQPISFEGQRLENYFTSELVENICRSHKPCALECLLKMGLQGNPNLMNKISAVTIPLGQFGPSQGFVLIYRSSQSKLTSKQLNNIAAVTPGLSQAIQSC